MMKVWTMLIGGALAAALVAGCTPEGRERYGEAGAALSDAVGTDLERTGQQLQRDERSPGGDPDRVAGEDLRGRDAAGADTRINERLRRDAELGAEEIRARSDSRGVVLEGVVPTEDLRQYAAQLADEVLGGQYPVENRIEVRQGAGDRREGPIERQ
jgi:osmotically-inducible protein OsmY